MKISNVNRLGYTAMIEEEKSGDCEVRHTAPEAADFIAFPVDETDPGYGTVVNNDLTVIGDAAPIRDKDGIIIGEVGRVPSYVQVNNSAWETLHFRFSNYSDPVVFMTTNTRNNRADTSFGGIRVINVNTTTQSFQFQFQEWNYLRTGTDPQEAGCEITEHDFGAHSAEDLVYLVLEVGSDENNPTQHQLDDSGNILYATKYTANKNFGTFNYPYPFVSNDFHLIAQTQTNDDSTPLCIRMHTKTASSIQIKLDEEEAQSRDHGSEKTAVLLYGTPAAL